MGVQVQRPSGVNVGVSNPGRFIYIKGNETTDGSWRLSFTLGDINPQIEERVAGVWIGAWAITGNFVLTMKPNARIMFDKDLNPMYVRRTPA